MNSLKNSLILLVLTISSVAYSQHITFGIHAGVGTYSMKGLKDLNAAVFKILPFQARILSDYPPYFFYKPAFLLSFYKFNAGFQAAYYSTGSRISSKDYSGEYLFNTKVNCIAPSVYFDYSLFSISGKYPVSLFSEAGITFSKLDLKEVLTVNNEEITNSSYAYKSKNYYVEPGFKVGYQIYRFINLELNTSYFFQFGKNVFKSDNNDILNDGEKTIGPDWSGLRIGFSVLIKTPFKKSTALAGAGLPTRDR